MKIFLVLTIFYTISFAKLNQEQVAATMVESKAMGILKACKNKYENTNNTLIKSIVKSNRAIFEQVITSGVECSENSISEIGSEELENLLEEVEDVEKQLKENNLLDQISRASMDMSIEAKLLHHIRFVNDDILDDQDAQRKFFSSLMKSQNQRGPRIKAMGRRYQKHMKDSFINSLKRLKDQNNKKISQQSVTKSYRSLGENINKLCQGIAAKAKPVVFKQTKRGRRVIRNKMLAHKEAAGREIHKKLVEFAKENESIQSLLYSETFRDVFPFDKEMADNCVNGKDIRPIDVYKIDQELTHKAIENLNETLDKDIKENKEAFRALNSQNPEAIKNSINEKLKYKPFLFGEYIKELNDPGEQEYFAKYTCQKTFDIYKSDQYWNIGLMTGGLVAGAVVGVITAGAGAGVGASLIAGTLVGGAEGTLILGSELQEAGDIVNGARVGKLTNKIDHEAFLQREQLAADRIDNGALSLALGGGGGLIGGAAIKGAKAIAKNNPSNLLNKQNISSTLDSIPANRKIDPEAFKNARLSDQARRKRVSEEFSIQDKKQLDAIMLAHNHEKLKCPVGKCSPDQLRAKLEILKQAGIDSQTARQIIRKGYAGEAAQEFNPKSYPGVFADKPTEDPGSYSLFFMKHRANFDESPHSEWLQSVQKSLSGNENIKPFKMKLELTDSNGNKVIKELEGSFAGTSKSGDQILFYPKSGGPGQFIDLNNKDLKVVEISEFRDTYVSEFGTVSDTKFIRDAEVPLYSEDTSSALSALSESRAIGKVRVKSQIIDPEDNDVITQDITGHVIQKDGKHYLRYKSQATGSEYDVELTNEKFGNMEISAIYPNESFNRIKDAKIESQYKLIQEKFSKGAPVNIATEDGKSYSGEFLGMAKPQTNSRYEQDMLVIRAASGEMQYIPTQNLQSINSSAEEVPLFRNPASKKYYIKEYDD